MIRKSIATATLVFAFALAPVGAVYASPDDYSPAAIEDASGPRDVGATIDDASGPRSTVTEDNPYGAGAALESANGPREVGAPIDQATKPRPVAKKK